MSVFLQGPTTSKWFSITKEVRREEVKCSIHEKTNKARRTFFWKDPRKSKSFHKTMASIKANKKFLNSLYNRIYIFTRAPSKFWSLYANFWIFLCFEAFIRLSTNQEKKRLGNRAKIRALGQLLLELFWEQTAQDNLKVNIMEESYTNGHSASVNYLTSQAAVL
jgi:hypothetical protein